MTTDTLLDLDNLEDMSMENTEAAPEFIEPPSGRYRLGVQVKTEAYEADETDTDGNKTGEKVPAKRIRFIYTIQEVLELKNKKELTPAEGSLFSESFKATAEGLRYYKRRAMDILGDLGNATIKDINNTLNEDAVSFVADVKTSDTTVVDKETGEKRTFTNTRVRVVTGHQKADLPA